MPVAMLTQVLPLTTTLRPAWSNSKKSLSLFTSCVLNFAEAPLSMRSRSWSTGLAQAVIAAIIKKVLAQPASSLPGIVTAMADSVVTDLSVDQIVSLALAMKDLNTDNDIYAGQLPTISEYIDDVWYEEIDNTVYIQ